MVPIRVMAAAPIAIAVHAVNVAVHLPTVFTMFCGVAINPCAVGLKPLLAIRL
jgi:hypothetical protein